MALSNLLIYAVALSLPAWLVAEQLHTWFAARTRRPAPVAAPSPAFTPDLRRHTA